MRYERFNFSDEFQDAILKCLILKPDKFGRVGEVLHPSFFHGTEAMEVCYAIKEYEEEFGKFPNFTTLANYMFNRKKKLNPKEAERMVDYIKQIGQADISDWEYIRSVSVKFARERAIYHALNEVAKNQIAPTKEMDPVVMMEKAMNVGSELEDDGIELGEDGADVIRETATKPTGIWPGFTYLDDVWRYGWQPGWLVTVLAPPKRYKTTFCLNIALNIVQTQPHHDVLYYACEIDQKLACMRTIYALTELTEEDLMSKGPEKMAAEFTRVWRSRVKSRLWFMHYPSKTANVNMIKRHAKRVIAQYGLTPKAIVIDYAETVRPNQQKKDTPDWRQSADVYTDARAMGEELNCVMIMPDRCNRDTVGKKVPNMKSFQGSFEKAGIVDVALGLCATGIEHSQNLLRVFVFLNRHGAQYQHFHGIIDPPRYTITLKGFGEEVDPDGEEQADEKTKVRRGGGKSTKLIDSDDEGVDALGERRKV